MFTFNVGCSRQLELAIIMSVSIEKAVYITISSSYYYLHFDARYRDTLGPILYIPTYINDNLYLAIDEKCAYGFSKITDVIITEGYLRIDRSAFANCPNLKSVQIPNSVTYIDSYAFENSNQAIITFTSGNNNITI